MPEAGLEDDWDELRGVEDDQYLLHESRSLLFEDDKEPPVIDAHGPTADDTSAEPRADQTLASDESGEEEDEVEFVPLVLVL